MAGRICFAGIYMTKGVPNLGRTNPRSKLGTPFSFLRCFPFCDRVLRTAPLDNFLGKTAYLGGFSAFLVLFLLFWRLVLMGDSRCQKAAEAWARIAAETAKSLTYP